MSRNIEISWHELLKKYNLLNNQIKPGEITCCFWVLLSYLEQLFEYVAVLPLLSDGLQRKQNTDSLL